ncbi:MAG TPA: ABC transporter ATP-binding protein [Candidatus Eremiobacteraceae bacterium]|nr:ABC transporter ATP-binding protein [Candidatus Eremiobacteraceae bacterium]
MRTTVAAHDLTRRFGAFTAVNHVSFEIEERTIWGFLGPNGAGKSTTIRMLCGIMNPTSGDAHVLGMDIVRDAERIRERIGYVSQRSSVWPDLTIGEHLRFYADMYGDIVRRSPGELEAWMRTLDLTEYRDVLGAAVPQGYRQRLALACAAIHKPDVLFLDEPTAGVDPVSRRKFWDIIGSIAENGATILVTTHYLDEAEHCDKLAFIDGGRIVAQGTPASLKTDPSFGYAVEVVTASPVGALQIVEELPFVRAATLFESALHVMLPSAAFVDRLSGALVDAQIPIANVRPAVASLEDVFASITSSHGQGTKPS